MSKRIYVVYYNRKYVVNIYELDHETTKYLFLKDYGTILRIIKNKANWYRTLAEAENYIKIDIHDRVLKLQKELNDLLKIDDYITYEIIPTIYNGSIKLE